MLYRGQEYKEITEGEADLGDLKIATGSIVEIHVDHPHGYRHGAVREITAHEMDAKYYRKTPPQTFEEYQKQAPALNLPDISRALRDAFEAGKIAGKKC